MSTGTELNNPWVRWASEVRELFRLDNDVFIDWDDLKKILTLTVGNVIKAAAIRRLLPEVKTFDKVEVKVNVVLADRVGGDGYIPEVVRAAFENNPLFSYMHEWDDPEAITNPMCWCVMDNRIIQYPDDNLNDIYGDRAVLPEQLMRDVIGENTNHIFYCTNNPNRDRPQ